jgi:hypothetical protein
MMLSEPTDPIQIRFKYDSIPTCAEFACSDAFIRGLMGPFGSAKSSTCVAEIIRRSRMQRKGRDGVRRTRWAVVRNTYGELTDTTMKTVEQWLPERYFGKLNRSEHFYRVTGIPECDIEIMFRALDKPEHVKKLLSMELTGAWINEAREVPWAVIEAIQGRVNRYPSVAEGGCTWSGVFMDTNPPDSDSSWFKFFEQRKWLKDFQKLIAAGVLPPGSTPEKYAAIFKQPSGLSPLAENLTNLNGGRGYYVRLSIDKTPEWKKVFIDGEYGFVVEGQLVYPEYKDNIHCKDINPVKGLPVIRSWDFGLTPAVAFSQILPDGRWLTFDEMVSENMSVDEFGDEVLEHCARVFREGADFEDWGDPSGSNRVETDKSSSFEILRSKGIKIEGASTNEPKMRQEAVRKALRSPAAVEDEYTPRFVLHSRCKVLRKGFLGGYHRKRLAGAGAGAERYSEKPNKNFYSHVHDGLQYGMVQYFAPELQRPADDEDEDDYYDGAAAQAEGGDTGAYEETGY